MGIGVTGLGQVHLPVADVERSVVFYRDAIGLPVVLEVPEQRMAFLGMGGVRLYLGEPDDEADVAVGGSVLYLEVADIARAWAALPDDVERLSPPHLVHADASRSRSSQPSSSGAC